jgi:hypothetical protein
MGDMTWVVDGPAGSVCCGSGAGEVTGMAMAAEAWESAIECGTGEAWGASTWKRENGWLVGVGSVLAIGSSDSAAASGRWLPEGTSYRFLVPLDGIGGAGRFSPLWRF